jgi:hypothetical protein
MLGEGKIFFGRRIATLGDAEGLCGEENFFAGGELVSSRTV